MFQALALLVGVALGQQEEAVSPRKIRLRRPRPVGIANPDGIAQGRPVPLQRQGKQFPLLIFHKLLPPTPQPLWIICGRLKNRTQFLQSFFVKLLFSSFVRVKLKSEKLDQNIRGKKCNKLCPKIESGITR